MAGIENIVISGSAVNQNGEGFHAWNIIKLFNDWYHLDVTWDDSLGDPPDYVSYDYFNLSDEEISQNHFWDRNKYPNALKNYNENEYIGEIEHNCSIFEPELCDTEIKCIRISGNWCNGQCQISSCSNQSPVIDSFTVDPLEGDAPLTVTLTCQAHDPDGNIAFFKWDFDGDGNYDQITNTGSTTHTYNEAGVYHPKCTVVDNDGAIVTSQSAEINVSEEEGNCLDENCPEGQSCLCFEALKCNSGEDSCEEEDFFRVGDHFKLNLCINTDQSNRFELVDLYVGIIPLQTNSLFLMTWNPWAPVVIWDGGEINSDVAYRQNLWQYSASYTIYDFEVPPGIGGTYDLYALFNRAGHPLDVFSLLSNLAYKRITFEDMR